MFPASMSGLTAAARATLLPSGFTGRLPGIACDNIWITSDPLALSSISGSRHGLGSRTMPEMLPYSVVCAVNTLWLVAQAYGIGVGSVSIIDQLQVPAALDIPKHWKLVAYLCLGYAGAEKDQPFGSSIYRAARRALSGRWIRLPFGLAYV
jgi:nitroreductase